jgi:leader peptidase (prepilin peptidase) / N-methyltransferase
MSKTRSLQFIIGIASAIVVALLSTKFILNLPATGIEILSFIILLLIILSLAYLSYIDLKSMEVDGNISLFLLIFLLLINLSLFFILGSDGFISVTENLQYIPYENLLAALILGSLFQLTVILSRETFLGQGDVRLALIVGLLIGSSNLWVWLNITIFTALAYALILAIRKRKFRGLRIPFVPFMVLGAIAILLIKF